MTDITLDITGTITFTSGSAAIVGTGTLFTGHLAGDVVIAPDGKWYELAATPTGDLAATLDRNYAGTTATGAVGGTDWVIFKNSVSRDSVRTATKQLTDISSLYRQIINLTQSDQTVKLSKATTADRAGVIVQKAGVDVAQVGTFGDDDLAMRYLLASTWTKAFGVDTATGATKLYSQLLLGGICTPATITADTNDYNPTGLAQTNILRLATDASRTLTGIAGGAEGRVLVLVNKGSNPLVLADQNAGSAAANRFAFGSAVTLAAGASALLYYDAVAQRWCAIGDASGAPLDSPTFTGKVSLQSFAAEEAGDYGSASTDFSYNTIVIDSDGRVVTGSNLSTCGLLINLNVDQASGRGQKYSFRGMTYVFGTGSINGDAVGVSGWAISDFTQGGTDTGAGAKGSLYGMEASSHAFAGATNYLVSSGGEANAWIDVGATAAHRWGWSISGIGYVRGALSDAALNIGAGMLSWNTGIQFASYNGFAPVTTTGSILSSDGTAITVANWAHFPVLDVTGKIMEFPHFTVMGNGSVFLGDSNVDLMLWGAPAKFQLVHDSGPWAYSDFQFSNDTAGSVFYITKSRATVPGTFGTVLNGDNLGGFIFGADDGTSYSNASAAIMAFVDGTPGTGNVPAMVSICTAAADGSSGAFGYIPRLTARASGDIHVNTGSLILDAGGKGVVIVGADSGIDLSNGSTITRRSSDGHVRYTSQNNVHEFVGAITASDQPGSRTGVYAAPFDAMAFNGSQVNGDMQLDQEHAGAAATLGVGNYAVDGNIWGGIGAGAATTQRVTDAPAGFTNSLKLQVTTAVPSLASGDGLYIFVGIEGYRVAPLAFGLSSANSSTVSFWVKGARTGTYAVAFNNSAWLRQFRRAFTISAANTWEYKTVTIPGDVTGTWDKANGMGLGVVFAFAAGSGFSGAADAWNSNSSGAFGITGQTNGMAATSDYFQITGVRVFPGTEAPSAARSMFVGRSFDTELALAQRYYEKSYPTGVAVGTLGTTGAHYEWILPSGDIANSNIDFKVRKRATPTFTFLSAQNGAAGQGAMYNTSGVFQSNKTMNSGLIHDGGHSNYWVSSGVSGNVLFTHWTASARI